MSWSSDSLQRKSWPSSHTCMNGVVQRGSTAAQAPELFSGVTLHVAWLEHSATSVQTLSLLQSIKLLPWHWYSVGVQGRHESEFRLQALGSPQSSARVQPPSPQTSSLVPSQRYSPGTQV